MSLQYQPAITVSQVIDQINNNFNFEKDYTEHLKQLQSFWSFLTNPYQKLATCKQIAARINSSYLINMIAPIDMSNAKYVMIVQLPEFSTFNTNNNSKYIKTDIVTKAYYINTNWLLSEIFHDIDFESHLYKTSINDMWFPDIKFIELKHGNPYTTPTGNFTINMDDIIKIGNAPTVLQEIIAAPLGTTFQNMPLFHQFIIDQHISIDVDTAQLLINIFKSTDNCKSITQFA